MADSHLVRSENHNAVNNGCQDTIVTFRERSKGCYVTRLKAVALVLTALGALLLVALLAAFFGRVWWCPEDNGIQDKVVNDGIVASTPSSDQTLPISDKIRLPYSLIPHRYQVDLVVNLTGFSFSGAVRIDLHVDKSTAYIIFHRHEKLNVSDASVAVIDSDTLEKRKIRSIFRVPHNQQYVVELTEPLKTGRDYSLHVGAFDGHLTTDLRGLYLSSYKTGSGKVRQVENPISNFIVHQQFRFGSSPNHGRSTSKGILRQNYGNTLSKESNWILLDDHSQLLPKLFLNASTSNKDC